MAKKKKSKPKLSSGPFLAAACFCETLLMAEDDKAPSAIRIVDTFTLVVTPNAPDDIPSEKDPLPFQANALIAFKGSNIPGKHKVTLRLVPPVGKPKVLREQDIEMKPGPVAGHNLRLGLGMLVMSAGVYFLDVYLDGHRVTRMPFQIVIQRAALPQPTGQESNKGKQRQRP